MSSMVLLRNELTEDCKIKKACKEYYGDKFKYHYTDIRQIYMVAESDNPFQEDSNLIMKYLFKTGVFNLSDPNYGKLSAEFQKYYIHCYTN